MIDLFSVEARRNPYPLYAQMRAASPVFHLPGSEIWMIFDYESVKQALHDHDAFSSSISTTASHPTPQWLIFFDPPRHTKLRGLITKAFTPRVVSNLEPRIRELSRELLDQTIDRGAMDLAADYGMPLPMKVIAELLGIPPADWPLFKRWSDVMLLLSYTLPGLATEQDIGAVMKEYVPTREEMRAYFGKLIEQRRGARQDDLLTRLVEAEVDGARLTPDEIFAFFQVLLVGGQETTANLIGNAVLCLLEHPDALARLRQAPDLLPRAIEEVLRYRSPLQWLFRATRRDVSMHGQVIPAGKIVLVMVGSANRDPRQFRDAERFDITRDPNPHLAFGHGIHVCLGAPLSRLEARIALADLLERLQGLTPASTQSWEPRKAPFVLGPSRLPIRFRPGQRHGGAELRLLDRHA
jgi:cytochrome P450